jgi:3-methyladenine DNA glycosylase AlkD
MIQPLSPLEIFSALNNFGAQNSNAVLVAKYSMYFREGYDAYGLSPGMVEEKVKEMLAMPEVTHKLLVDSSFLLVSSPKYEIPVFAFRFFLSFHKQWTLEDFRAVEKWFSIGINNWAHTDYICGELMSLFFKKKLIDIQSLNSWRTSENRFQRRAAAVSLIKPMKLSSGFTPYFDFIEPMMHDPERVVHQGLGWLLREMWKKQPEVTEMFLLKHKNTAPRLIFQYATEKMSKEGKEKFRRKA